MNVSRISPVAFQGTFHPPKTDEWKKATASDKNLSKATSDLSNFVGKKLEAWVKVSLNFDADSGKVTIVAKNDKRKERVLTTSYSLQDFIQHRQSLQEKLTKKVN